MSRQTELSWVASVVAAEAVRDYSDTALMLYGVRLGSVSFPLLGTKLPSRVSAAPWQNRIYNPEILSTRQVFSTIHRVGLMKCQHNRQVSIDTMVMLD